MRLIWTSLVWICGLIIAIWAGAILVGWTSEHKIIATGCTLVLLGLGALIVIHRTTK